MTKQYTPDYLEIFMRSHDELMESDYRLAIAVTCAVFGITAASAEFGEEDELLEDMIKRVRENFPTTKKLLGEEYER